MITRRTALGPAGLDTAADAGARAAPIASRTICRPLIEAGKLPALAQRLPHNAARGQRRRAWAASPGQYGGDVRMLIGGQRDIRLMTHQRLCAAGRLRREARTSSPTSSKSFEVEEDRIFTFKLRDGPQMVRRRAAHGRGLPLHAGRTCCSTRTCRPAACRRRCWSTASRRRSRSSTS